MGGDDGSRGGGHSGSVVKGNEGRPGQAWKKPCGAGEGLPEPGLCGGHSPQRMTLQAASTQGRPGEGAVRDSWAGQRLSVQNEKDLRKGWENGSGDQPCGLGPRQVI